MKRRPRDLPTGDVSVPSSPSLQKNTNPHHREPRSLPAVAERKLLWPRSITCRGARVSQLLPAAVRMTTRPPDCNPTLGSSPCNLNHGPFSAESEAFPGIVSKRTTLRSRTFQNRPEMFGV